MVGGRGRRSITFGFTDPTPIWSKEDKDRGVPARTPSAACPRFAYTCPFCQQDVESTATTGQVNRSRICGKKYSCGQRRRGRAKAPTRMPVLRRSGLFGCCASTHSKEAQNASREALQRRMLGAGPLNKTLCGHSRTPWPGGLSVAEGSPQQSALALRSECRRRQDR